MHPIPPHLRDQARRLRAGQTEAERKLWNALRGGRLAGAKFRRQQVVGPYIVDFCSWEHHLVVEVDGGQHAAQAERDLARTEFLRQRGLRVLRFWNNEVLQNLDGVLRSIVDACSAR